MLTPPTRKRECHYKHFIIILCYKFRKHGWAKTSTAIELLLLLKSRKFYFLFKPTSKRKLDPFQDTYWYSLTITYALTCILRFPQANSTVRHLVDGIDKLRVFRLLTLQPRGASNGFFSCNFFLCSWPAWARDRMKFDLMLSG